MHETLSRLKNTYKIVSEYSYLDELSGNEYISNVKKKRELREYCYIIVSKLRDLTEKTNMHELEQKLLDFWLDIRFEWMRLNSKMNFNQVVYNKSNPLLACQASYLTYIMLELEKIMDKEKLDILKEMSLTYQYIQ
ncbi:MAG: hypothetical protein SFU98_19390 [Leptospiraceae bacterium]|nr:hypothetical protein [Leptospiraceae bacterium]